MLEIYKLIQENPGYFAWAFGLVNVLWVIFFHFNKQSHERRIKKLENELKFDSDRRIKIFELKSSNFSSYVAELDMFGKKTQTEMLNEISPVVQGFLSEIMAEENEEQSINIEAFTKFTQQIQVLLNKSVEDVVRLKAESNKLKLIATDEILKTLEELEGIIDASFNVVSEFMRKYPQLLLEGKENEVEEYKSVLEIMGRSTKDSQNKLLMQMREEIGRI